MSDTGDDYRGDYKQAMDSALNGRIGFYADFDSGRQEEVWRLLSALWPMEALICSRLAVVSWTAAACWLFPEETAWAEAFSKVMGL